MVTVEQSADRFSGRRVQSATIALLTLTVFIAAVLYVGERAPGPANAPAAWRPPTQAEVAGLTRALTPDWNRAWQADTKWDDLCHEQRTSLQSCAGALRKQVAALQQLSLDVGAQRLSHSRLEEVVYTRFLPSIANALAAKRTALRDLRQGDITHFRQAADRDPSICIQPVSVAIRRATGGTGPQYLSYPSLLTMDDRC